MIIVLCQHVSFAKYRLLVLPDDPSPPESLAGPTPHRVCYIADRVQHGLQAGPCLTQNQPQEQLAAHWSKQVGVVTQHANLDHSECPPPRPPSPLLDSVREKYSNPDRLAEDFTVAFQGCELADVVFIVGEDRIPLYAVKALLACRSRSAPPAVSMALLATPPMCPACVEYPARPPRVMCTLFKEVGPHPAPHRLGLSSPMARRRLPSSQVPFMSPQSCRKNSLVGGKARLSSIGRKKKLSGSGETSRSVSPSDSSSSSSAGGPCSFGEDPRNMQIKEQVSVMMGLPELGAGDWNSGPA